MASTHMTGFSGWNNPDRQDELLWYLFDRFRGLIAATCARFGMQHADTEDFAMDLWHHLRGEPFDDFLARYRVPGGNRSFEAWLRRCVRNRAINLTTRQRFPHQALPNEQFRDTDDDSENVPHEGDSSFPLDEFADSVAGSVVTDFEQDPFGPLHTEALQEANPRQSGPWPLSDNPDSDCIGFARDRVRESITPQNMEAVEMVVAGRTLKEIAARQNRTVQAVREAVLRAADMFRRFRNECLDEEASK